MLERITHKAFVHKDRRAYDRDAFNLHSSSVQVMREAEITESGTVIGGRSISNVRYADDTALCGKSSQEINNIVHKVNYALRIILLKLNACGTRRRKCKYIYSR